MQSKSATKKKSNKAAEAASVEPLEAKSVAATSKQASKKSNSASEVKEAVPVKRHRSAKPAVTAPVSASAAVDAVEPSASSTSSSAQTRVSEHEIRELAYRFWVERGQPHGSHQDDWLRAEQTLSAGA